MINDISRITKNILDAFSKPGELPGGAWTEDEKSWRQARNIFKEQQ